MHFSHEASADTVAIVNQKGFTLIELSIVLTIIALIIGGIIVGRDLIRVSELNSVTSDVARYTQAITDFRDTYLALPGDFAGAEALWGSDSNCPTTATNTTPKTATCNGDGNGRIAALDCSSGACVWTGEYEMFRVWQHLSDAGFIGGTYSGVTGPAGSGNPLPGVNSPQSAVPGGVYNLCWEADPLGVTGFPASGVHHLSFGSSTATAGAWGPLLTSLEALNIDQKLDDGLPGTGNIVAPPSSTSKMPNCATTSTASTAQYKIRRQRAHVHVRSSVGLLNSIGESVNKTSPAA